MPGIDRTRNSVASSPGKFTTAGELAMADQAPKASKTSVSIVVPVYNEAANLDALWLRLGAVAARIPGCEVVFVDDGSRDDSLAMLREIAAEHGEVRVVELARNFGQHAALLAGFRECR